MYVLVDLFFFLGGWMVKADLKAETGNMGQGQGARGDELESFRRASVAQWAGGRGWQALEQLIQELTG